jgi:hypothetical protein
VFSAQRDNVRADDSIEISKHGLRNAFMLLELSNQVNPPGFPVRQKNSGRAGKSPYNPTGRLNSFAGSAMFQYRDEDEQN